MPHPRLLTLALAPLLAAAALAQDRTINWSNDVEGSVAIAKKQNRPLMFYVTRASNQEDDDLERSQKRAFQDPRVLSISKRFVTVRLSASVHREMLQKWNRPANLYMYVVFATPQGEFIDSLDGIAVGTPEGFAQKMAKVYGQFRRQHFEKEVKPVLDKTDATTADLKKALDAVQNMQILDADAAVAALLKRDKLDPKLTSEIYKTLEQLSTKASGQALFERAKEGDEQALKALQGSEPGAAEPLLPLLSSKEPTEQVTAYLAIAKICKIKEAKPAKFFEGKNRKLIDDELERVQKQAEKVVKRWKEEYAEYR